MKKPCKSCRYWDEIDDGICKRSNIDIFIYWCDEESSYEFFEESEVKNEESL